MIWINVEHALPPNKHEVMYFATIDNGQQREIMVGHREDDLWTHCCMFYSTRYLAEHVTVTHWMELPDYPKFPPLEAVQKPHNPKEFAKKLCEDHKDLLKRLADR
jgi:hypothetical protein